MPYSSVSDLPVAVRAKLKGKRLRQWMHVFNSAYDRHGDESRAFAEAWATVEKIGDTTKVFHEAKPSSEIVKAQNMREFQFFLPIAKVDKERRTVSGYASTPTKDSDGEIVTLEAVKAALPGYMDYGNIREMHALKAIGVAQEADVDSTGLFLTAKIVDDAAWKKCLEGVYKGFSIGGRKLNKEGDKITAIDLTEISVVDRPANPDCRITIAKSAKSLGHAEGHLLKLKALRTPEQKAMAKMAKAVGLLTKGGPPAAHDGFSLPAKGPAGGQANGPELGPNDPRPNENETRKTGREPPAAEAEKGGNAPGEGDKPYGDVAYADPGYQADKKKRYPIDTEEHIRAAWNYINKPKNAKKYSSEDLASVKAKIVSAWKAKIDKEGPPSAKDKEAKKLAKRALAQALALGDESFLVLKKHKEPEVEIIKDDAAIEKSMSAAGPLTYVFDSVRNAQRSLLMEASLEGGDMKDKALAKQLGMIAKQLAQIIGQKAEHEGAEAETLSDADDQYLLSILGKDMMQMDKTNQVGVRPSGDPLTDAVAALVKRAAQPTREQRLEMASDNTKKSRKAMKECRKALEEVHAMHKSAYLSKAAKKGEQIEEFDHAKCMEKLNKAYGALDKARTFGKAAQTQIAKAAARSGQRGQEVGDAEAGFYEVPAGVKDLSPAALAGASPGGGASGSQPPMYPGDGSVYAGKAEGLGDLQKFVKNGAVAPEVMELLLAKAKAEGELDALRRIPASAGNGRRPFAFDLTKAVGGGLPQGGDLNKALFDGVDVHALQSGDERRHTEASAKLIGNFLTSGQFGKSVFDPAFKGAAGSGR